MPTPKPRPKNKSKADEARNAYTMLEISPRDVAGQPRIEHLFRRIGGAPKVWEYLQGSEEPEARKLLEFRARLTVAQTKAIPFEAFCVAAQIPVKRMFGIISEEVMEQSAKATELLAKARHPEVVEATIKRALGEGGTADAKMLHQAAGFVPTPKNSFTVIRGNVDARTQQQTNNISVLPPLEETGRRLSNRFNSDMRVPAALPPPDDEGEQDDDDEDEIL